MTPLEWMMSEDTGVSSETIMSVMEGASLQWTDAPYDPDDFGRCYRLLRHFPHYRDRMGEVAEKYPKWRKLVEAWDELTALYEEELPNGTAPKLYKRMKALLGR